MRRALQTLAAVGFVGALALVILERLQEPASDPPFEPHPSPFEQQVAGLGTIEASTQNVSLGTPVSGIVSAIEVEPGDRVQTGDVVARIDSRDVQAHLVSTTARLAEAQAVLAKAEHELSPAEELVREHVMSQVELTRLNDDVAVDLARVTVAEALVGELEVEIDRRTIRSPVSGRVLRVNVRPGELATADPAAMPLMVIGDDQVLLARVEVDERDAWKVAQGTRGMAMPRGNPHVRLPLRFVRIEPYVAPKSVLSGRSGERTDVRVMQVLFALDAGDYPLYIGQEVDVLIEVKDGARTP